MRLIFNNFLSFFSPLEQFEINSFNTPLSYTADRAFSYPIDLIEAEYFTYFLSKINYSIFDCLFILGLLFIFQTFFKQKGFIFLFILTQILLVGFNWISFTETIFETSQTINLIGGEEVEYFNKTISEISDKFILDIIEFEDFFPIISDTTFTYVTIITSFTNIYSVSFCFIFIYFVIYLIYNKMLSNNTNTLIPTLYQILAENLYKLSLNLFYSILGKHISIPEFFIKINTIFIFLVISNVQGMIPYMSTLTSALTNTFFIALALFLSILTTLLDKKGINYFLNLFMPSGCPILLSLLIIPIELISYSFRLVSLSVRLFANMMAGHTLLKVIVGFSWIIIFLGNTWLINLFPILILFILTLLEFGVAIIQAYIFTVLSCIYLRDIFEGH